MKHFVLFHYAQRLPDVALGNAKTHYSKKFPGFLRPQAATLCSAGRRPLTPT